jgi:hypothetical protein
MACGPRIYVVVTAKWEQPDVPSGTSSCYYLAVRDFDPQDACQQDEPYDTVPFRVI